MKKSPTSTDRNEIDVAIRHKLLLVSRKPVADRTVDFLF